MNRKIKVKNRGKRVKDIDQKNSVKNQMSSVKDKDQRTTVVKNQIVRVENMLKALSRTYLTVQQYRIANSNRLVRVPAYLGKVAEKEDQNKFVENQDTIVKGDRWKLRAQVLDELVVEPPTSFDNWDGFFKDKLELFYEIEKMVMKRIKKVLVGHPIWEGYLKDVNGVGPVIAASLIGEIGDANRFEKTSDLWAYAGKAVIDGKAQRRTRGQKSNWNKYLQLALWKFGSSVMKVGARYKSKYCELYYSRKQYEIENHDRTCKTIQEKGKCSAPKLHIHSRAIRYVEKKFLSDLYHYCKGE